MSPYRLSSSKPTLTTWAHSIHRNDFARWPRIPAPVAVAEPGQAAMVVPAHSPGVGGGEVPFHEGHN